MARDAAPGETVIEMGEDGKYRLTLWTETDPDERLITISREDDWPEILIDGRWVDIEIYTGGARHLVRGRIERKVGPRLTVRGSMNRPGSGGDQVPTRV